jgi:uncharacterized membrane protein
MDLWDTDIIDMDNPKLERLNRRDIVQIGVGSFVGALVFVTSSEIMDISDNVPFRNIYLIAAVTILFSYAISYVIGVRKLGKKRIRMVFGFVPERMLLQYFSSILFSFFLLRLLGICTSTTSLDMLIKGVVVLAMPSTITASAADLIESQKGSG